MTTSEQVISLTSSDEEDSPEPPPKKMKTTPLIVPQVTLTLVKNTKKKEKQIETVTLDSDDDIEEVIESREKASPEPPINTSSQKTTANNSSANLELITLTDDEEDAQVQTKEINAMIQSILGTDIAKSVTIVKKSNSVKTAEKVETVSLTDSDCDSDSSDMEIVTDIPEEDLVEQNTQKQEKSGEELQEKPTETIQDKSLEEVEEKPPVVIKEKSSDDIQEKLTEEMHEQPMEDPQQKASCEVQEKSVAEEIKEKLNEEKQEKSDDGKQEQAAEEMQENTVAEAQEKSSVKIQETLVEEVCNDNIANAIENNEEVAKETGKVVDMKENHNEESPNNESKKNVKTTTDSIEIMVIDEDVEETTVTKKDKEGINESEVCSTNENINTIVQAVEDSTKKSANNANEDNDITVIDEDVAEETREEREKSNEEIAENAVLINEEVTEQTSTSVQRGEKSQNINNTNENMEIVVIDKEAVEETSTANDIGETNKTCEKIVNKNDEIMVIDEDIPKETCTLIDMTETIEDATNKACEKNVIVANIRELNEEKVCEKNVGGNEININGTRDKELSEDSDVLMYDSSKDVYISLENIECDTTGEKHSDSIVIDDSDEDTEKENHCEAEQTCASDIPGPSEPPKDESVQARAVFKKFLKIVEHKIVGSSFEGILPKKVPIIEKYFKRCGPYVNETVFAKLLKDSTDSVSRAPNSSAANTAVLAFHRIFEHLKSRVAESTIEIEEEHLPKVKKLEKTMKLLRKRIKQLEEAEVNFDDDEDSAYIMLDRYQARLNKVYAKYCQYIRRNPFSGRPIYDRISFVHSKYNEINQAISRKYRNSINFPSYYELEKYIAKISKKEKLDLSEQEIKHESKKCFKHLGGILQKKRRQELYDSHLDFIEFTEDPATKDITLENLLRKNYSEGKDRIEKIYEKFVNKQEQGEDHISSDDAGTSEGSDSEENNKNSRKGDKRVKKIPIKKSKKENEETGNNLDEDKEINGQLNENRLKTNEIDKEKIVNGHIDKVANENIEKT